MTRPLLGSGTLIMASDVTLDPPVRGESSLQAAMMAGIPLLLEETSFFSTTAVPPGAIYATDSRVYEAGLYQAIGIQTVSASNNNTEVEITLALDDFNLPDPWVDTPGSTGVLTPATTAPVQLTAGVHKFDVKLSRVSGTGDAQARSAFLWLTRIG